MGKRFQWRAFCAKKAIIKWRTKRKHESNGFFSFFYFEWRIKTAERKEERKKHRMMRMMEAKQKTVSATLTAFPQQYAAWWLCMDVFVFMLLLNWQWTIWHQWYCVLTNNVDHQDPWIHTKWSGTVESIWWHIQLTKCYAKRKRAQYIQK